MKRLLPTQILLATFVMMFCGCEKQPSIAPSKKIVKIGIIAPFSGSDFAKGEEGLRGVETAMAIRPLLDNGDKIELVTRDDQNDAALATKALADLVHAEQVAAVVTFSSSGPVLAMAKNANAYQTPITAALATHPEVTKGNDYVSQTCFDNTLQGYVAAFFVRDDLLVDRVAIFKTPTSFYSRNLAAEFEKQFVALGGKVTEVVEIREGETDLADTLARVREKDPELLYLPLAAQEVIAIIQAVDQMGWDPREMASDGLLATVFSQYEEDLDLLDGLLATDFFHHDSLGTDFGKRATKIHRGAGTSYTAMGVEAFSILQEAMNRCDDPSNRACINRQIQSTTDFEGLMGKITIDATGKAHRPVIINSIKSGRLEYILKVY
jgi:branched-chain amino acid transport system substrate-binding protein